MRWILIFAILGLTACKSDVSTVQSVSTVYVKVPAPCPEKAERERLLASRPVPLRNQSMPATAVERVAKQGAQLGKYEAPGGWSDQVTSALQRCGRE